MLRDATTSIDYQLEKAANGQPDVLEHFQNKVYFSFSFHPAFDLLESSLSFFIYCFSVSSEPFIESRCRHTHSVSGFLPVYFAQ